MTKKPLNTFKTFDVVIVPFPFVDMAEAKNRPAIIISAQAFNNPLHQSIMAMITSAKHSVWPLDTSISHLSSCGLEKDSIIRLKLFTIDNRLIKGKIGILSHADQKKLQTNFYSAFNQLLEL